MPEEYTDSRLKNGIYKKLSELVVDWLEVHAGENFTLDEICRSLEINERDNRRYIAVVLNRLVVQEKLEKINSFSRASYIHIDKTCKNIDWVNAIDDDWLQLRWPWGREDTSEFGFKATRISPGDVIVIAGNSNAGKTAFVINFLFENMDNFPCTLMGNEYTAGKFKRRVKPMTWANPLKEEGTPKFELIDRRQRWKDIIRPDNINIIDWINLEDNFYQVGMIIDGIQSKLKRGIALVVLQKNPDKSLGRGGGFSMDLASLYLSVEYGYMTVMKAKEWNGYNPNNKMYGFELVDSGTKFHNIREVKKCPKCGGFGKVRGLDCEECFGKGYVDK